MRRHPCPVVSVRRAFRFTFGKANFKRKRIETTATERARLGMQATAA